MFLIKRKRFAAALIACLMTLGGCAEKAEPASGVTQNGYPAVEAGIAEISKHGNLILTVSPETMMELGYEEADLIDVEIGSRHEIMPVGTNYSDVDYGKTICRYDLEDEIHHIALAVSGGSFAGLMEVADKEETDDEKGYQWIFRDGIDENAGVRITMAEKQGYAEELKIHKITASRTNERSGYPDLSDAEYANFRAVSTSGMGKDTLFRSASPVNPKIGRNKEADEALSLNGVHTIINLADYENEMKEYPDYSLTYYSKCVILNAAMSMDMTLEENRQKLASAIRFINQNEGPYLIHCLEGKDRTGYVAAILECLMGAELDEVVDDYMVTYYNFYGLKEGDESYDRIAALITGQLNAAFGTELKEGDTLAVYAEQYLKDTGLSDEEIAELKTRLGKDYGGQN
jgi:hypothetical protein